MSAAIGVRVYWARLFRRQRRRVLPVNPELLVFHEAEGLLEVAAGGRRLILRPRYGQLWALHRRLGDHLQARSQERAPREPDPFNSERSE